MTALPPPEQLEWDKAANSRPPSVHSKRVSSSNSKVAHSTLSYAREFNFLYSIIRLVRVQQSLVAALARVVRRYWPYRWRPGSGEREVPTSRASQSSSHASKLILVSIKTRPSWDGAAETPNWSLRAPPDVRAANWMATTACNAAGRPVPCNPSRHPQRTLARPRSTNPGGAARLPRRAARASPASRVFVTSSASSLARVLTRSPLPGKRTRSRPACQPRGRRRGGAGAGGGNRRTFGEAGGASARGARWVACSACGGGGGAWRGVHPAAGASRGQVDGAASAGDGDRSRLRPLVCDSMGRGGVHCTNRRI